jgi:SHS2 domain-containing protein
MLRSRSGALDSASSYHVVPNRAEDDTVPARLEYLEHTADVGFDVTSDTLDDLFRTAASGMFELLMGSDAAHAPNRTTGAAQLRQLSLRASDVASLLVDWLRELLYWHETEGIIVPHIEFTTLTERQLDATVRSFRSTVDPIREIKGVTYHQLDVHRQDGVWQARVIFDV